MSQLEFLTAIVLQTLFSEESYPSNKFESLATKLSEISVSVIVLFAMSVEVIVPF